MKKFAKILILVLSFWVAIFSSVAAGVIFAQTPTDTPTPTVSPTDSPTGTQTATDSASATLASSSASPTNSPTNTPTDSPRPAPADQQVTQSSTTNSNTSSSSDSGSNTQTGAANATASTGNSTSASNSVTISNLNKVNSNLIIAVQNILSSNSNVDVNLYQKLLSAIANNPAFIPANTTYVTNQSADVNSTTSANTNTGGNTQEATGSATLITGQALAIANAITAANFNLIGSNAVLAIINIFGNYGRNIILPNSADLSTANATGSANVNLNVNQSSTTSSTTTSVTNTGGNKQEANQSAHMNTGSSSSSSNSLTLSNVNQMGTGWRHLMINNNGNWSGALINWLSPGSHQILPTGTSNIPVFWPREISGCGACGATNINVNQTANLNSVTTASASTGNNYQNAGSTSLVSGNAGVLVNSFSLANLNLVGGSMFFGIINILGNFTGNIIAAYPELNVSLTDNQDTVIPGSAENYVLTVTNSGHAIAHNVSLNFSWPQDVIPNSGQTTSWNLGTLNPGQSQTFNLFGSVLGSVPIGTDLIAAANTATSDTQDSTGGNTANDSTAVTAPNNPPPDSRTPDLTINLWDSVGAFVNPGDSIWTKIYLTNATPSISRNTEITGKIYNDDGSQIIPLDFKIGDVRAAGHGVITFNVTIPKNAAGGKYHIGAQASGQGDGGNSANSNYAQLDFLVSGGITQTVSTGGGRGGDLPGEVLEASATSQSLLDKAGKYAPQFFISLGILYMAVFLAKRRLSEKSVVPTFPKFPKAKKVAIASGLVGILAAAKIFVRKMTLI